MRQKDEVLRFQIAAGFAHWTLRRHGHLRASCGMQHLAVPARPVCYVSYAIQIQPLSSNVQKFPSKKPIGDGGKGRFSMNYTLAPNTRAGKLSSPVVASLACFSTYPIRPSLRPSVPPSVPPTAAASVVNVTWPAEASAVMAGGAATVGPNEVHDLFHAVAENVASPECIAPFGLFFSSRRRNPWRSDRLLHLPVSCD